MWLHLPKSLRTVQYSWKNLFNSHPCHRRRSSMNKDSRLCLVKLWLFSEKMAPLEIYLLDLSNGFFSLARRCQCNFRLVSVFKKDCPQDSLLWRTASVPFRSNAGKSPLTHRRCGISYLGFIIRFDLATFSDRRYGTPRVNLDELLVFKRSILLLMVLCFRDHHLAMPSVCQNFSCFQIKSLRSIFLFY